MKTKKLIKKPDLKIQSGQDGVWLHFKTSTGLSASINLHVMFGPGGRIFDMAICQWAKEYAIESAHGFGLGGTN